MSHGRTFGTTAVPPPVGSQFWSAARVEHFSCQPETSTKIKYFQPLARFVRRWGCHENAWSHENELWNVRGSATLERMDAPKFELPFESVRGLLLDLAARKGVAAPTNERVLDALVRAWRQRHGPESISARELLGEELC